MDGIPPSEADPPVSGGLQKGPGDTRQACNFHGEWCRSEAASPAHTAAAAGVGAAVVDGGAGAGAGAGADADADAGADAGADADAAVVVVEVVSGVAALVVKRATWPWQR